MDIADATGTRRGANVFRPFVATPAGRGISRLGVIAEDELEQLSDVAIVLDDEHARSGWLHQRQKLKGKRQKESWKSCAFTFAFCLLTSEEPANQRVSPPETQAG